MVTATCKPLCDHAAMPQSIFATAEAMLLAPTTYLVLDVAERHDEPNFGTIEGYGKESHF